MSEHDDELMGTKSKSPQREKKYEVRWIACMKMRIISKVPIMLRDWPTCRLSLEFRGELDALNGSQLFLAGGQEISQSSITDNATMPLIEETVRCRREATTSHRDISTKCQLEFDYHERRARQESKSLI